MSLEFRNIGHRYAGQIVVTDVGFAANPGEILALLGPSGAGKSTLLRLAAGLEMLQQGTLHLDGAVLAAPGKEPPPEQRPVGLVFQDHVLFPHKTVAANVGFGLPELTSRQRAAVVAEQLDRVGLTGFGERFPHTLSGGEQQRVALARALAPGPRVMLLDEPFASIDATLRRELREDARLTLHEAGTITIVVTHDAEEALEMADRIVVMEAGRVLQDGTPEELWNKPAARLVAATFGRAQTLAGSVREGLAHTGFGAVPTTLADGTAAAVVVRPDAVSLDPQANPQAHVRDVRFLGDAYLVLLGSPGGDELHVRVAGPPGVEPGQHVGVRFAAQGVFTYSCE